ncbi:uncharacterized protein LOC131223881 isoform X2 [Magnolia sinica]|uniref:uncharacterized protein LOC131223881 isoform X2 n=1 Tax=Magnolia sinica TaxID=86752 RepID=UPI00265B44B4|nr:uncharacterized protein LOC131223881 isoform X2 [Magnolia sinica]
MLDSTAFAPLLTFYSYEFRPTDRKLGFFRCNPKRGSCRIENLRKIDGVDPLKPLIDCDSDLITARFYGFGCRTPKLGLLRFDLKPRSGNVACGKIDGGGFPESLDVGNLDGVGSKNGGIRFIKGGFEENRVGSRQEMLGKIDGGDYPGPLDIGGSDRVGDSNGGIQFVRGGLERRRQVSRKSEMFGPEHYGNGCNLKPPRYGSKLLGNIDGGNPPKSMNVSNSDSRDSFENDRGDLKLNSREVDPSLGILGAEKSDLFDEVVTEKEEKGFEYEKWSKDREAEDGHLNQKMGSKAEKSTVDGVDLSDSSSFDFLELKRDLEDGQRARSSGAQEDSDLVPSESSRRRGVESEEVGVHLRSQRQVLRRSNMIAKQVISMQSALSLGFVSQLWVDTRSWVVLLVEVRPSMLSGEMERFLLEDVCRVGDVVLVQDESVMENELKMIGLDTLVGYNVMTPGCRNVGKVSTYGLFVEDVLEVTSDTVVVHEDAASRIQRLTKGFWDSRNTEFTGDEQGEYSYVQRWPARSARRRGRPKDFGAQKFVSRRETADDWELPMDY